MRIFDHIIQADMARITALENLLRGRQWHQDAPEPRRLKSLIAAERALLNKHIEAAEQEQRSPLQ